MPIDIRDNTIITANAVLYKKEGPTVRFLLAQENDGNWGLPGGAKNIEDTDLMTTIKRELSEELDLGETDCAIQETPIKRNFEYNHFQSSRFGKHGIVLFFIVFVPDHVKIKSSGELADVAWFTKKDAAQKLTFEHVREGFEEVSDLIMSKEFTEANDGKYF